MKKLLCIGVLLLIFNTGVHAAPTLFQDVVSVNQRLEVTNTPSNSTDFTSWTHVNPFVPHTEYDAAVAAGEIVAALTIGVEDLDPSVDILNVWFTDKNSTLHDLGLLNGGVGDFDQTFGLDASWLNGVDVDAGLYFNFSGGLETYDITITTSTLSVEWDPASSPATAPAPGAVFLGSIGVVVVGWLRRRRAL